MKPFISLVTGTYQRIVLLQAMVKSFRDNIPTGIPYEIVVVDGGSRDGTQAWCKSQPDIVLIEHNELKGAIIAFTEGCFAAKGKTVLIANDDISFFAGSILPAIIHLENNPTCGAVAFADNRPLPPHFDRTVYKTLRMPVWKQNGTKGEMVYPQVGLVRKWLGDKVHWWAGEHDEMLVPGLVYAGDNNLAAHMAMHGYTVATDPRCKIEDVIANDELRQINYERGKVNDDSSYYFRQWKDEKMPHVLDKPDLPNEDKRAARILYLPIYEPGWAIQHDPVVGKRGLRDAFTRARNKYGEPCIVAELDYLSIPADKLQATILQMVSDFQPDIIFTQIQGHLPITAAMLMAIRKQSRATIINWNGDYAIGGLTSPEMLQLLKQVDLQLVVNATPLELYKQHGINAAYWQIGFEDVADDLLPDGPKHDVVWLASLYNDNRKALDASLNQFDYKCYQPGDVSFPTLYNFATSKALYRNAKIAISNNDYPEKSGFVSNRIFQILASGETILLQQKVDGLFERLELQAGVHYIEWRTNEELPDLIRYWLDPKRAKERRKIAEQGTQFVREHHSFDARVAELFELIKTRLGVGKQLVETVTLKHKGTRGGGGWPSVKGSGYEFQAGGTLTVLKEDAELMLQHSETWQLAEGG